MSRLAKRLMHLRDAMNNGKFSKFVDEQLAMMGS